MLCFSDIKSLFLNKPISVINSSCSWLIKSYFYKFNFSMKLLLKSSNPLFMPFVFWCPNIRNRTMFRIGCNVQLEIILYFIEWLACSNSNVFWKLSIVMASSKESFTSAKSSSLPHFLFFRLSVSIEATIRSWISLPSMLTWGFAFSEVYLFFAMLV